MFSLKAMSQKSSSELLKRDCPTKLYDRKSSASKALRVVSTRQLCLSNKKMALQTLEILVSLVEATKVGRDLQIF